MKKNNKANSRNTLPLIAYARRTYLRYQQMRKAERTQFLNEIVKDFGGHRKSIIRLFSRLSNNTKVVNHSAVIGPQMAVVKAAKQRGAKAQYADPKLIWWLQTLWIVMNQVNEKLMHAMLPKWLEKSNDPGLPDDVRAQLLKISPATIERLIRAYKREYGKRHYCATKASRCKNLMATIPVRVLNFEAKSCGYLEGDTVAHCGSSLIGTFAWSLNS